jgi:pimeloyl-ACP methyl ester carboxylesterase
LTYTLHSFENTSYLDEGEGKVVILLHGLFGSLSNFDGLIHTLSKKYRVILPQLPIFQCDLKDANLDGLFSFLERFVDILKLDNFSLLGNSLGGHLGLKYVLAHPHQVNNLVLTASSGLFENALGSSYPRKDRESLRAKIGETFGDPKFATDELVDNVIEIINNKLKLIKIIKMAKSATRQNLQNELHKINNHTLLIWGSLDTITPDFVAHQFQESIPNATLHFIEGVGHAPMMEAPKIFADIVLQFYQNIQFV